MGKIIRISGPVVIAEDVDKARMYDVVRVGNAGLVGEIIRIVGSRSTIQVYEDTSGIRPGEPVENTYRPLSVDLGPGLLSSIYDGIQRPLDVIREKSGDFIRRGFTASPLNETRKWEFVPSLKKGDKVVPGQIIGSVQETGIINHKIMVPLNVHGEISSIESGMFTVSETVATVRTENGKVDIRLKQEWPVRQARKVSRKLPPESPLITGQRVIDTFFPVAKGGTVAVPGPFGSGKCVSGDTPVILANGEVIPIEEIFRRSKGEGPDRTLEEEYVFLETPLELFSYNLGRIVESRSHVMYRGKSDLLVALRTESGREVKVTPVHKLFRESDGNIVETPAIKLRVGDRILVAAKIPVAAGKEAAEAVPSGSRTDLKSEISVHAGNKTVSTSSSFLNLHQGGAGDTGCLTFTNSMDAARCSYMLTQHGVAHRIKREGPGAHAVEIMDAGSDEMHDNSGWAVPEKVVKIELLKGPFDVYDFYVPDFGSNFIGGFGGIVLHNTVVQHQLSKWADSDVVVYVGCGERGNEMTEILTTFPELQDPKSGRPLMERTVLIANTSNMPVAAREASIYTGITIAEYYRDMGYDVALMADSTSRWAEALREISGRLEEMPGEEGYPAYLGRRLSEFYERSGNAITLGSDSREGSVSVIGAVSPPGGDISEPVSQNTLRVTRVFWALDSSLASRRHFPSINWRNSYSLYQSELRKWFNEHIADDFGSLYDEAMGILQKEAELQEVVQLVGYDALPEREKSTLDIARLIREDFLQQSAFDEIDTYSSIQKQYRMLKAILEFGRLEGEAITKGASLAKITQLPVRVKLSRMKTIPEDAAQQELDKLLADIDEQFRALKS